jgi:hypothetical protein
MRLAVAGNKDAVVLAFDPVHQLGEICLDFRERENVLIPCS